MASHELNEARHAVTRECGKKRRPELGIGWWLSLIWIFFGPRHSSLFNPMGEDFVDAGRI